MKRIIFGITSLDTGGAERVLVDLVNELCGKYDITIFTLYGNGKMEKQLDSRIKVISVYKTKYNDTSFLERKWLSIQLVNDLLRKQLYKRYIKDRYDVVVAFLEGPVTWLFSEEDNLRKIVWVHSDIKSIFGSSKKSELKQRMNERFYNRYDMIVFVSKDNLETFIDYFPNNMVKKEVVYNYLNLDSVIEKARQFEVKEISDKGVSFLQVSRLVEAKAIPRLIKVHKRLIDDGYSHKIYIIGSGPLREEIDRCILENNVMSTFIMLGEKENPYPYIKKADYFILGSKYEGYGMVLLEAKVLNKYIIITDTAAREAVSDYENKMIVDNSEEGLYKGIMDLIVHKKKCKKEIGFNNKNVIREVEKVIEGD